MKINRDLISLLLNPSEANGAQPPSLSPFLVKKVFESFGVGLSSLFENTLSVTDHQNDFSFTIKRFGMIEYLDDQLEIPLWLWWVAGQGFEENSHERSKKVLDFIFQEGNKIGYDWLAPLGGNPTDPAAIDLLLSLTAPHFWPTIFNHLPAEMFEKIQARPAQKNRLSLSWCFANHHSHPFLLENLILSGWDINKVPDGEAPPIFSAVHTKTISFYLENQGDPLVKHPKNDWGLIELLGSVRGEGRSDKNKLFSDLCFRIKALENKKNPAEKFKLWIKNDWLKIPSGFIPTQKLQVYFDALSKQKENQTVFEDSDAVFFYKKTVEISLNKIKSAKECASQAKNLVEIIKFLENFDQSLASSSLDKKYDNCQEITNKDALMLALFFISQASNPPVYSCISEIFSPWLEERFEVIFGEIIPFVQKHVFDPASQKNIFRTVLELSNRRSNPNQEKYSDVYLLKEKKNADLFQKHLAELFFDRDWVGKNGAEALDGLNENHLNSLMAIILDQIDRNKNDEKWLRLRDEAILDFAHLAIRSAGEVGPSKEFLACLESWQNSSNAAKSFLKNHLCQEQTSSWVANHFSSKARFCHIIDVNCFPGNFLIEKEASVLSIAKIIFQKEISELNEPGPIADDVLCHIEKEILMDEAKSVSQNKTDQKISRKI